MKDGKKNLKEMKQSGKEKRNKLKKKIIEIKNW